MMFFVVIESAGTFPYSYSRSIKTIFLYPVPLS
jgi:hypothetical protein